VRHLSKKWRIIRRIVYLIIVLLTFNLIYNLWDVFPNKPIYICYGAILATQVIVSLKRYEITAEMSFYFPIAGVVLFSISDNLLAFLKFNAIKSDLGRSIIMLTYYSSQYFIMHGSLHQSNLKFELDQVKKSWFWICVDLILILRLSLTAIINNHSTLPIMSLSRYTKSSCSPTLTFWPPYSGSKTRSPTLTAMGMILPLLSNEPGPASST